MFFCSKNTVQTKLIGPNLVAVFANAHPPLTWKFDLERNHSFTIGLQGEEGDWELGLTSPKGEFYPIAHFPLREDADEAMAQIGKILMKKRRSPIRTLLKVTALLLLGAVLGIVTGGYMLLAHTGQLGALVRASGMMGPHPVSAPQAVPEAAPALVPAPLGVPVPADDILKAPH